MVIGRNSLINTAQTTQGGGGGGPQLNILNFNFIVIRNNCIIFLWYYMCSNFLIKPVGFLNNIRIY